MHAVLLFLRSLGGMSFLVCHSLGSSPINSLFLRNKKRNLIIHPLTFQKTWSNSVFLWECRLWYHLSSCLFALKELSLKGGLYSVSVWTQYTSTVDVTIAADIDSSGLSPSLHDAIIIEGQMLEAEGVSWLEMNLLAPPRVSEDSKTVPCVPYFLLHTWHRKWKHQHVCMPNI